MEMGIGIMLVARVGDWVGCPLCIIVGLAVFIPGSLTMLFKGAKAACKASYAAVTGKESFKSAFKAEYHGLRDFEFRAIESTKYIEEIDEQIGVFDFQIRGLIPHDIEDERLQISVNIIDKTGDRYVYSSVKSKCEPGYKVFLFRSNIGEFPINVGFKEWTTIGGAFKQTLIFPFKGQRNLVFNFVLSREDTPRSMFSILKKRASVGSPRDAPITKRECYACQAATVSFRVDADGYIDREKKLVFVHGHTIRLAMCMSAVDGSIDKSEGNIIKDWATLIIQSQADSKRTEYKKELNDIIRESHKSALGGNLDLSGVLNDLKGCATEADCYQAFELILDVMTADGKADKSEMELLDNVTKGLGLNPAQVAAMRDRSLADVGSLTYDEDGLAPMVGIDMEMSKEEMRLHLNAEFKKWNSRQARGGERDKKRANEMLNLLSRARKKYLD